MVHRLRHQVGLSFGCSWQLRLGFYWFGIVILKSWRLPTRYGETTGLVFSYKPNRKAKEGDFIWLKQKEWLWAAR